MPGTTKPPEDDKPPETTVTAPAFVPSEEFKAFQQVITGTLGTLNETIGALKGTIDVLAASRNADQQTRDAEVVITEEQFDAAIQTGDAKVIRAYSKQQLDKIRREEIDPLRTQGVEAITALSTEIATAKLKHYPRFKKEIDGHLATLPPASRMNPAVIKAVHDAVVGQNIEALTTEATEVAIRGAADKGSGVIPGQHSGRDVSGTKVPTVVELLGQDSADALDAAGRTPDTFARRLGYKDWAAYAALAQKQRAGEPAVAAAK